MVWFLSGSNRKHVFNKARGSGLGVDSVLGFKREVRPASVTSLFSE